MLTAIIIARNEELNIASAVRSVSFSDEVLVIDNASSDKTSQVAQEHGARVVTSSIEGDFGTLRNFAVEQASNEWILFIDADEAVSDDLRVHIKHELEHPQFSGYYLRRRDHFWGRILEHGEVSTVYERGIIRLMKKATGAWKGNIHEEWTTDQVVGGIDGFIEHYPHPDIGSFLESINTYSTIRARELGKLGERVGIFQLIAYPIGKFVYTYIIKSGYRDGAAGFVYSFMMSFHSFLVRAKAISMKYGV
ncbi:glycosyltransferase family 2 protein [Candidatus Woesebacteria bacterium]|nr:glycosyltransferase family 2 protein [Candidatus Woesebacteria bacterium]